MAPGEPQDTDSLPLPSEEIYNAFETETDHCELHAKLNEKQKIEKELKTVLDWLRSNNEDCARKIVNAFCFALTMGGQQEHHGQRCNLLYYWIGDQLRGNLSNSFNFPFAISLLHITLHEFLSEWSCNNTYQSFSKELFGPAKILYDYYYDYIKLQENSGYKKSTLCPKLEGKLQGAKGACRQVEDMCKPGSTADAAYCKEFKAELKKKYEEILESDCEQEGGEEPSKVASDGEGDEGKEVPETQSEDENEDKHQSTDGDQAVMQVSGEEGRVGVTASLAETALNATEQLSPVGQHSGEVLSPQHANDQLGGVSLPGSSGSSSTTVPVAVSGALAVIGLLALALMLYKYGLLPSWISDSFFGGRSKGRNSRNRRTARGHHNLDTLTDGEGSTIGSIADSSTTYSIPYTTSSSR